MPKRFKAWPVLPVLADLFRTDPRFSLSNTRRSSFRWALVVMTSRCFCRSRPPRDLRRSTRRVFRAGHRANKFPGFSPTPGVVLPSRSVSLRRETSHGVQANPFDLWGFLAQPRRPKSCGQLLGESWPRANRSGTGRGGDVTGSRNSMILVSCQVAVSDLSHSPSQRPGGRRRARPTHWDRPAIDA
jgi:hypothetical protein